MCQELHIGDPIDMSLFRYGDSNNGMYVSINQIYFLNSFWRVGVSLDDENRIVYIRHVQTGFSAEEATVIMNLLYNKSINDGYIVMGSADIPTERLIVFNNNILSFSMVILYL